MKLAISLLMTLCFGATGFAQDLQLTVKNNLDFDRTEVAVINRQEFSDFFKKLSGKAIRIKKQGTEAYLPIQWIDYDLDGSNDALLFQVNIGAKSNETYVIIVADSLKKSTETERRAYCRFVPERSDDFAWENDKVAFRVYGPKGQKEALNGVSGSTLSSGVDIWFKKVGYPIIDNWYKKNEATPGYYHTDHGEGYDPYHVGKSRGVGGTGILVNDTLQVSDNFSGYKVIASGPLRVVFELTYAPWSKFGVAETKRLSLDMGSNFTRFDIMLTAMTVAPNYAVGLSLHENTGEVKINNEKGWFRHWEKIDDAYVGEAIIMSPKLVSDAFTRASEIPDESNLLVATKAIDRLTYYAGFAWQGSKQVQTAADWDKLLDRQVLINANPLKVTVWGGK